MPSRTILDVIADLRARYDRGEQLETPELQLVAGENFHLQSLKELERVERRYLDVAGTARGRALLQEIEVRQSAIEKYWRKVWIRAAETGLI